MEYDPTHIAHEGDRSLSTEATRTLFSGILCFAVVVPILVAVLSFLYAAYTETRFTKSEIKSIVFWTWSFTIVGLVLFGLLNRRGVSVPTSAELSEVDRVELTAAKWEQRKSARLIIRGYLLSMLLPLFGIGLGLAGLLLFRVPLGHRETVTILQIYAAACLILVARSALRSRSERMVYLSTPDGLKS